MARSVVAYTSRRKLDETNYIRRNLKTKKAICDNCGNEFEIEPTMYKIENKIFCSWNCKCEFKRKNNIE